MPNIINDLLRNLLTDLSSDRINHIPLDNLITSISTTLQHIITHNNNIESQLQHYEHKERLYKEIADKENYPLGFPIYDRLAKASYNNIRKHSVFELPSIDNVEITIEAYVRAMNKLREKIFQNHNNQLFNNYQQFDILDAYLWRMGKFSEGNLTLLMDKEDYKKFITNIGLNNKTKEEILKTIPSISSNDTNYFNKAVLRKMQQIGVSVFNGLSTKPYLTQLYNHWKKYF
jgi:hypothetical protein